MVIQWVTKAQNGQMKHNIIWAKSKNLGRQLRDTSEPTHIATNSGDILCRKLKEVKLFKKNPQFPFHQISKVYIQNLDTILLILVYDWDQCSTLCQLVLSGSNKIHLSKEMINFLTYGFSLWSAGSIVFKCVIEQRIMSERHGSAKSLISLLIAAKKDVKREQSISFFLTMTSFFQECLTSKQSIQLGIHQWIYQWRLSLSNTHNVITSYQHHYVGTKPSNK